MAKHKTARPTRFKPVGQGCYQLDQKCQQHSSPKAAFVPTEGHQFQDLDLLGFLFAALPQEIRDRIFALLIVRTVKWDVEHNNECLVRRVGSSDTPQKPYSVLCPACNSPHPQRWRLYEGDPWVSPWRSQWAPQPTNPYLCSDCFDDKFRPELRAGLAPLPCLCARRQNLQVMLVCHSWYEQAARIFYTENVFAFESGCSFVQFVDHLNPRWRRIVSKASIMAKAEGTYSQMEHGASSGVTVRGPDVEFERRRDLSPLRSRMRQLTSLSSLELDSLYLARAWTAQTLLRLGPLHIRHVRFVTRLSDAAVSQSRSATVWPVFAGRVVIQGGLAEEIARAIKGERSHRLKTYSALCAAVTQFGQGAGAVQVL